jgi:3-isopropylmalate/(R)-2-methylmalate dehydratase small subunit
MQPFTQHTGLVLPLDRPNVDTDAIIPKQYLKSIRKTGFGVFAFDDWRYLDKGDLDIPVESRRKNPEFIMNRAEYKGASILLAQENFGCGSSREHAVWALADAGFRAVIAPSFADIFFNNSFKNGFLPLGLPAEHVAYWMSQKNLSLSIDLPAQTVSDGVKTVSFEIDNFRKKCLIEGLDEIGLTLQKAEAIRTFESKRAQSQPWL